MKPPLLVGDSPAMRHLVERLDQVADTNLPIVIVGETGTGKEVAARLLHYRSGRTGPFVAIDCGALSPSLVEAELFGYERGAFTGATQRREGLVRTAHHGTFFLDEIGELPLDAQTRLLRVLQEGTYRPLGSETSRSVDLRVVTATWRNLEEAVREGRFRRDLYHRLAVVELVMPPLRKRRQDITLLWEHFAREAAALTGRPAPALDASARAHLEQWPWPGNVRELQNTVEYVCAMARGGTVSVEDLPNRMLGPAPALDGAAPAPSHRTLVRTDLPYMEARRDWLDIFQRTYVSVLLEEHDGNISAAARAAGMDRRSIQRILARDKEEDAD